MPRTVFSFSFLGTRSMTAGFFVGSSLIVISLSAPSLLFTVNRSPLIVTPNLATSSIGTGFPFSSIDTTVHLPWSFSTSFLVSASLVVSACTATTTSNAPRATINEFRMIVLPRADCGQIWDGCRGVRQNSNFVLNGTLADSATNRRWQCCQDTASAAPFNPRRPRTGTAGVCAGGRSVVTCRQL